MMSAFGARLRLRATTRHCGGLLTVHRWEFAPGEDDLPDLAIEVGRAYVSDAARIATPRAGLAPKVPTNDNVVAGDFGEMLTRAIYGTRMGMELPFSKLQSMKPVADATVQGPDVLCLTLAPGDDPEPVTVEAKTRTNGSPSAVLGAIGKSTKVVDEDYLVSAWAAGAELMLAHPDHERHFAMSAAQHLGRLIDPDAALPPHSVHAVAIVGADKITAAKLSEHWSDDPPVSVLHVVTVPNVVDLRSRLFVRAGELTYADLTEGAAAVVPTRAPAGVTGLLSPGAATRVAAAGQVSDVLVVVEAALWFLADQDGIGLARAQRAVDRGTPAARGLAQLLTGALSGAIGTLAGHPLRPFAESAKAVVSLDSRPEELIAAVKEAEDVEAIPHDVLLAVRHVAAALLHRLQRHPVTLTAAAGATGPAVRHVIGELTKYGKHALWPSQAAAVQGGLLDREQKSLAIKMPTSAGKTTLMQLLVADELDRSPGAVVAVLGPTRALVGQLYGDLRDSLPGYTEIRASQGGHDYDVDTPSSPTVLAGPGVVVVTPERFDLDWRRAATGDSDADLDALRLLVVDEAQLIDSGPRGAALERVIARALRAGVRVVLVSSQFSDVQGVANWIGGKALESDWRPAWLERLVYFRGPEGTKHTTAREGYLWSEGGVAKQVLTLKPSEKSDDQGCVRDRKHETAAMVQRYVEDGLVVVFTDRKDLADGLLRTIRGQLPTLSNVPPPLEALATSIEQAHPEQAAALREGLGLHHADVPRAVKGAIERAARRHGGLLRCIVCTPTLLEGVDFPARTVVAAYPPQNRQGVPDIARLRNLAGRAGRGGKFTSGRLVVMAFDHQRARKWRKAFRTQLPATETALTAAMKELLARQPDGLSDAGKETLDALTIEVLADASATDGDLRRALEAALEQTVWSATSPPQAHEHVLDRAEIYALQVAAAVPDDKQRNAFYRSGLKLKSCIALRARLADKLDAITERLSAVNVDQHSLDALLHFLIAVLVVTLDELDSLRGIDRTNLKNALDMWMSGASETAIEVAYPDAWEALTPRYLETLLPWALTGAFEIIAALAGDLDLRERAHRLLKPVRLRDGVPDPDLCGLVRDGADRVRVARIANEVQAEREANGTETYLFWADPRTLASAVEERLRKELAAEAAETGVADSDAVVTQVQLRETVGLDDGGGE